MNAGHFLKWILGIPEGPSLEEFKKAASEIDLPWNSEAACDDFAKSPDAHGSFSKQKQKQAA